MESGGSKLSRANSEHDEAVEDLEHQGTVN